MTRTVTTWAMLAVCCVIQAGMAHMLWADYREFRPAQSRAAQARGAFDAATVRSDIEGQQAALEEWREALSDECRALRKEFLVFPDCRLYNLDP